MKNHTIQCFLLATILFTSCTPTTAPVGGSSNSIAGTYRGYYQSEVFELRVTVKGDSIGGEALNYTDNYQTVYSRGQIIGSLIHGQGDTLAYLLYACPTTVRHNQSFGGQLYAIKTFDTLQVTESSQVSPSDPVYYYNIYFVKQK